jgi:hypothetical protein
MANFLHQISLNALQTASRAGLMKSNRELALELNKSKNLPMRDERMAKACSLVRPCSPERWHSIYTLHECSRLRLLND